MTTPTNDRQTSERERLAEALASFAAWSVSSDVDVTPVRQVIEQLRVDEAELAALRAENEALRTVTEDGIDAALGADSGHEGWRVSSLFSDELREHVVRDAMRAALQSFIRSKEARRAQE